MRKIILATALAAALIPLTQTGASAAWPAPIGHRQPNAAEVPPNDSVIGESSEGRSAAGADRAGGSHPPVGSRVNHASMLTEGWWGKVLSAHSPIKPSRAEGRAGKRMSRLQRVWAGCPNIQSRAARRPVARSKNYKSRQKKGWKVVRLALEMPFRGQGVLSPRGAVPQTDTSEHGPCRTPTLPV
jgi:hypothetical protein